MSNRSPPNGVQYTIRSHRPGDIGHILSRHGALYAQDYGFDIRFEGLVARIGADFIDNYDPTREHCWVVEAPLTGVFLGSVTLIKHKDQPNTAQLRLYIVEPAARGMGLGTVLLFTCIDFAREAGYNKIVLWTYDFLVEGRKRYKAAGFELMRIDRYDAFGQSGLVAELWELDLGASHSG